MSEGCRNCYAERNAIRFARPKEPGAPEKSPAGGYAGFVENTKAGPRWTGKVELIATALDWPLRKRKPLRIFVNSMSDLFHEKLSDESIAAVFGVMAAAPQHTFLVLTKRPERMRAWFSWVDGDDAKLGEAAEAALQGIGFDTGCGSAFYPVDRWPLPNVWLGVSAENQATADARIPHLLATPAAKRFVSYEPGLGPVNFHEHLLGFGGGNPGACACGHGHGFTRCQNYGGVAQACTFCDCRSFRRRDGGKELHWIIVGGESGPGARPFDIEWARSTVRQCREAGVAVFVKQLGNDPSAFTPDPYFLLGPSVSDGRFRLRTFGRDRSCREMSQWPEDLRVREFPQ